MLRCKDIVTGGITIYLLGIVYRDKARVGIEVKQLSDIETAMVRYKGKARVRT